LPFKPILSTLLLSGAIFSAGAAFSATASDAASNTTPAQGQTPQMPQTPFSEFAGADGALTVFPRGDYVEPYSAIKALIAAHRLGVDVHAQAEAFTAFIKPFQQANGPFPRICRSNGDRWLACGPSDADDSLAVMWCALSSEVLPEDRRLDATCERALENLATLWEPQKETFRAMFGGQAAYFADNVEVMMFLKRLRAHKSSFTRHVDALAKLPSQAVMEDALRRNYGYDPARTLEPKVASLPPTPYAFYPYGVAPLYPMIYDLRTGAERKHDWAAWRAKYGKQWLDGKLDHFPWGLAAWAAYQSGDRASTQAWLDNSVQWKKDNRWNIMEEGMQLGLKTALAQSPETSGRSHKRTKQN
jgi:hypothetical protein